MLPRRPARNPLLLVMLLPMFFVGQEAYPPTDTTYPGAAIAYPGGVLSFPPESPASGSVYDDAFAVWTFNDPDDLGHQDAGSCGSCDLTEVNTPTATGGALGYAADLELDSTQYATTGADTASLDFTADDPFYVACWFRPESVAAAQGLASKDDGSDQQYGLRTDGSSHAEFYFHVSNVEKTATTTDTITAGSRHFIEGWRNASDDKAYVNIDRGTPVSAAGGEVDDTDDPFEVGRYAAANPIDGVVGPCVVHSVVPSDAVKNSIYNFGKGKTCAELTTAEKVNMVSCWEMDEDGGPYIDSIGSNTLTAVNTPTRANGLVERSDSGMAVRVDNSDASYLENTSFVFDYSNGLHFAAWVNEWSIEQAALMDLWEIVGTDEGFWINYVSGQGGIAGAVQGDVLITTLAIYYSQNEWRLVEGWLDPVTKKVSVAVDNSAPTVSVSALGVLPTDSENIRIGRAKTRLPRDAALDNAVLWPRPLTQDERDELWDSGAGTFYAALMDFIFDGPRFAWSQPPEIRRVTWH